MSKANHPRYLNKTDVIDKGDSTAKQLPVSADQLRQTNARVTAIENIGIAAKFTAAEARITTLEAGMKILRVAVSADANTAPMALPNATTKFVVGTRILDVWVVCTDSDSTTSLQLKHGGEGGAAITNAMACETVDVLTRAALLSNPVVTADGLVIAAGATVDRGEMYILYI